MGTASFISSEGWKRIGPRLSQRWAPRRACPTTATARRRKTPLAYSHGEMRRRKFGLTRARASIAAVPSTSRIAVRSTIGSFSAEAL